MSITAERLAQAMELRGVDQSELARRVDVTQGAISKIIVGKTTNSRMLPKIAATLGVSLPWLLGTTGDMFDETCASEFTEEERNWVQMLRRLDTGDRAAVLQLAENLGAKRDTRVLHDKQMAYRVE
ncbi:helix-turn-helix domain-containing protein [Alteraurantiacibacter palmitatis]|uniref:Helix-turn-helix domain-containing protein n=1 Tax=Alteraurantiacibacter palmitatis TaxID=2054628 RepID=A0ABV7E6V6_9SPHN